MSNATTNLSSKLASFVAVAAVSLSGLGTPPKVFAAEAGGVESGKVLSTTPVSYAQFLVSAHSSMIKRAGTDPMNAAVYRGVAGKISNEFAKAFPGVQIDNASTVLGSYDFASAKKSGDSYSDFKPEVIKNEALRAEVVSIVGKLQSEQVSYENFLNIKTTTVALTLPDKLDLQKLSVTGFRGLAVLTKTMKISEAAIFFKSNSLSLVGITSLDDLVDLGEAAKQKGIKSRIVVDLTKDSKKPLEDGRFVSNGQNVKIPKGKNPEVFSRFTEGVDAGEANFFAIDTNSNQIGIRNGNPGAAYSHWLVVLKTPDLASTSFSDAGKK